MIAAPLSNKSQRSVDQKMTPGESGLRLFLDRGEVLYATVDQLCKDLGPDEGDLVPPEAGEGAFEELREQVLKVLTGLWDKGPHSLQVAMYRVDIPEGHMRRTLDSGGLHALAGETVLRCLQKVLTRLRHAGRF